MRKVIHRAKAMLRRKKNHRTESEASDSEGDKVATETDPEPVVIVGAGIVGLSLALALHKHCGVKVQLYEQAKEFHIDVGAGMGMYPNGLRVLRDISPDLFERIQQEGCIFEWRRWERHDGTEVITASEEVLSPHNDSELKPVGIRRWKLQRILLAAAEEAGIRIHFDRRLVALEDIDDLNLTELTFGDGSKIRAQLVLAADGSKSQVRSLQACSKQHQLVYTGTTCLMGTSIAEESAALARAPKGLCLPSSDSTNCHGALYPTGDTEQCFQFHFPTPLSEAAESATASAGWGGGRTHDVDEKDCQELIARLLKDGWDEKYLVPLRTVDKALKISFSTLEPALESYVFGRCVLVGDSAHPPVPYLGQGAQQGLEDAGTLALLLKHYCFGEDGQWSFMNVEMALNLYNQLRLPRTLNVLDLSKSWGAEQQNRASAPNPTHKHAKEEKLRRDVFYNETLPHLLPAVKYDYNDAVHKAISKNHLMPVPEEKQCS